MNELHPKSARHRTMSRFSSSKATAWAVSQRSLAILGAGFSFDWSLGGVHRNIDHGGNAQNATSC
jgi:hypothetical protein